MRLAIDVVDVDRAGQARKIVARCIDVSRDLTASSIEQRGENPSRSRTVFDVIEPIRKMRIV